MALKKKPAAKKALTAATADRHALYEAAVQATEADIDFIDRVYRRVRGTLPLRLREDFCGTAQLCADWVKGGPKRLAVGLDLHQPTMDWGRRHHLEPLGAAQRRVTLLRRDVLQGVDSPVDVTVAFNFSYCIFKQRQQMLAYFRGVRAGTRPRGAFFLDVHGGTESFEEMEESTRRRGFTYVWDQAPYNPISGHVIRRIHFRFADGTAMNNAFVYDWRMWTLPELRDLLYEAGFAQVDVYWEGADARGNGDGNFRKVRRAENEAAWVSYVVAWRQRP